jgi:ribosome-associated translation inhibitor RaiA
VVGATNSIDPGRIIVAIDIQGLNARDRARMMRTLQVLPVKPTSARVAFIDDNGPKGGRALRCTMTVRLPHRPGIRVEHTSTTAKLAFDGALARLERRLERYREIQRERQRHPKKYYAAKRLLA